MTVPDGWEAWQTGWDGCRKCPIGRIAYRHVLGSGSPTATILVIGEAPGRAEDVLGEPFIGAAGRLLRQAVFDAKGRWSSLYITNLIACRPTDAVGGDNRPPTPTEIENCRPRLVQLIQMMPIRGVLLLGRTAHAYAGPALDAARWRGIQRELIHPAAILRQGGTASIVYQQFVAELHHFFDRFAEVRHAQR